MKKYILMLMMLSCTVFTTTSCEKEDGDEMEEYAVIEESGTNPSTSSASKSIPVEELPSLITDYIAANYPTAVILEAEQEDDGEYEVTLDNGLEIKFDADGNFLEEEKEGK
ncbi:MAG: PepSY-like domain-containing protein [Chitinophagales bacterium]